MLIDQLTPDEGDNKCPPPWVSSHNVSIHAWTSMIEIFEAKREMILREDNRLGSTAKKNYQITQKEIAKSANCDPSTLHNRRFSTGFRLTLSELNEELAQIRNDRIRSLKKVGLKDRRKSEILAESRRLARELEAQKQINTKKMVEEIFTRLPLRARRALMLE